jgi:cytochrome P450
MKIFECPKCGTRTSNPLEALMHCAGKDFKTFVHWGILYAVPQAYLWAWKRRKHFWLQIVTDPTADQSELFDKLHRLIPISGLVTSEFAYLTGSYDIVTEALHNHDLQVMSRNERLPKGVAWLEQWARPEHWDLHPLRAPGLNAIEGEYHQRLRKAVREAFSLRLVKDVEATANRALDAIEDHTTIDLLEGFCRELPAMVIGAFFGLSAEDVAALDFWRVFDFALTSLDVTSGWATYRQNHDALSQLIEWVRDQAKNGPTQGFPRRLVGTDKERIVTSVLMLEAGFITTVHMLGSGIRLLLENPDQLALLRQDKHLWPNAIEEIIRMETPLRLLARKAVCDTTLAGHKIRKGKMIVLNLAAANRDPAVFADPHRFDVTRVNAAKHLAFSTGRHYCLGPALARLEGRIALQLFFERFPDTRMVMCERESRQIINSLSKLVVHCSSNDIFDWELYRLDT